MARFDGIPVGGRFGGTPVEVGPTQRGPLVREARTSGFLKGYMDQASGLAQLASRLGPDSRTPEMVLQGMPTTAKRTDDFISREEIEYQRNRGEEGIDWARMAGNMVNPVAIGTIPAAPASIPAKIGLGAAYGAAQGVSMPVTDADNYNQKKALQGFAGAAIGAFVPSAVETVKGAFNLRKYLMRPFSKEGRLQDLKEMYVQLAGDSRDAIVESLDEAKTYIYGNKPTSGLAIAEKNIKDTAMKGGAIVRFERDLSRKPATGDPLKTDIYQQSVRRAESLNRMIDSSDAGLAAAKKARTNATKDLYALVEKSTKIVDSRPVERQLKGLIKKNRNQDKIARPLRNLLRKMTIVTEDGPKLETNPGQLYSLSKQISDMMSKKTPGGQNEYDVMVLSNIKKILDGQIGKADDTFRLAQEQYAKFSTPINQIEVTRYLGDALKDSVNNESPRPFLTAIKEAPKTLKKSTGFARYDKLDQVLNSEQIKRVNQVKNELLRQDKSSKLAASTESTYPVLKQGIEPELPNMLSRPALLVNAMMRRIGKDKGPEYEKLAVSLQQNPELLADLLRKPANNKHRQMAYELMTEAAAMIPVRETSRQLGE